MDTARKLLCLGCGVCLAAVVSASLTEHLLKVPLLEVGGLWVRATRELLETIRLTALHLTDMTSPWSLAIAVVTVIAFYYMYQLFWAPMNRIRRLGDTGYVLEKHTNKKDAVNRLRRLREVGDVPPVYPNGWFAALESRDLALGCVKHVSILGLNLAVFRGEDERAHVVDAYCPHIGANMAVGGRVIGSCLECPFHGWKFRGDDGKCVHIPTVEKVPEFIKVKSYDTLEQNGFIYTWYHAEGLGPTWTPPELESIDRGDWTYFGRTEHEVNAHIEDVPENGADIAHLGQVHSPLLTAGVDLRYMWSKLWDFGRHEWSGGWVQDPDDKHVGALHLRHGLKLFGIHVKVLDLEVVASQIGPGIVHLSFDSIFGKGVYLMSLVPMEPLVQKMVHHLYMNWWVPPIVAKFFLLGEALMVERDVMVWNNKTYARKPMMVKSAEDQLIVRHRRWYSQFYSENSPRLKFQKDTLDW